MKKILTIIFIITALQQAKAQQDILVSQYMFNHLLLNPAYAGSKEYMMATLLYRKQWVNFKGAPETEIATLHGPLGNKALGWGLTVSNDHIGVTNRTDGYLSLAYHLKLNNTFKLGMGIKAGGDFYSFKNSDLKYWDTSDPTFAGDKQTGFQPNLGAGLYLYSETFYAGLSVPTIISYDPTKSLSVSGGELVPHQVRHYFATAGIVIPVSDDVIAKPSVLVKYVGNAPVEADINLNFLFANLLWVGGSYRTGDSFVAMIELQFSKQWRIGYSYDFTMTDIKNYSTGSHEIMLGYDFGYDIMKVKTPRYF
ncbi:MAG: type IX secretion system membrane protein PorP/SprF [Bacteroidetes bacterium]|nr:type IX secretion system membrane protein PorP/SprF [Bacteroidota bacterium]